MLQSGDPGRVPCFINRGAGHAGPVVAAIADDPRLEPQDWVPGTAASALRAAVDRGVRRIAIAGGDGTVAAAADVLIDTDVEIAIIPAGTLNHFARSAGIPTDPRRAVASVTSARIALVDAGFVNDRLFLGTSSVGAYVRFVRTRERYERYLGYYLATAVSSLRTLFRLRPRAVNVVLDGETVHYRTPLVFVGVGERELRFPAIGERVRDGESALHVIVARGNRRTWFVAMSLGTATHGNAAVAHTRNLDSYLVDECTIDLRRRRVLVALDGETHQLETPLHYRLAREALRIVVP